MTFDRGIESEGDNIASIRADGGQEGEGLWALGFGAGAQDEQEYEIQIVNTDDTTEAILQTTITTAAAGAGAIDTLLSISWANVDAFMGIEDTNIDDIMGIDSGE
jgi:hypothetical protein